MGGNCLIYRRKGQKEAICVGTARSQSDFGNFQKNVDLIQPFLAIIVSPSEVEWIDKPKCFVHTWVDEAQRGGFVWQRMGCISKGSSAYSIGS